MFPTTSESTVVGNMKEVSPVSVVVKSAVVAKSEVSSLLFYTKTFTFTRQFIWMNWNGMES